MNRITDSLFAFVAGIVLVGCSVTTVYNNESSGATSSAVPKSSSSVAMSVAIASSSSKSVSSSTVATSSSSINLISSSSLVIQSCIYSATANTLACSEQTYNTVMIGTQTWMAQNLNYKPLSGKSWCYNDSTSYCNTYGRLYDYLTALTVCPSGWHLPDTTEWNTLEVYTGDTATTGTKLKSTMGWYMGTGNIIGTNTYNFSALPGGDYGGAAFGRVGYSGYWWTATAYGNSFAYFSGVDYNYANMFHNYNIQTIGFSVRCLKDTP